MVSKTFKVGICGPGLHAPALFLCAVGLAATSTPLPAQSRAGQTAPPAQKPAPARPTPAPASPAGVPDQQSLARLVWSTMAAVDQANKTGNYSVLRDLGSAGFQANNNASTLANVFAAIRNQRVDLSDTLLLAPTYEIAALSAPGVLRVRGSFGTRPTAILFDLLYQWDQGWRLEGVAILPRAMPTQLSR